MTTEKQGVLRGKQCDVRTPLLAKMCGIRLLDRNRDRLGETFIGGANGVNAGDSTLPTTDCKTAAVFRSIAVNSLMSLMDSSICDRYL